MTIFRARPSEESNPRNRPIQPSLTRKLARRAVGLLYDYAYPEAERHVEDQTDGMEATANALAAARRVLDDFLGKIEESYAGDRKARTNWIRDKQDAETKRQALRDQYRDLSGHYVGIGDDGAGWEVSLMHPPTR